ncbi:hypothetical protein [Undibacterium sp. Di24W]|uniref:hypothetical protein n=1 Tax=Undibacterium sp. Di24W TaxID=3413033 RepID=UPI003BF303A7
MNYLDNQLDHFFPDGRSCRPEIEKYLDRALVRLNLCINAVKIWKPDQFDHLHSSQYCTFLYFLSNTMYRDGADKRVCTKLFLLNKALNAIDLFYEIEMPDIFFIGHSVGIVLAKANYANYLVLYQNSTVGKNHGIAPKLEEGVIMYPNTAIIGDCHVKAGSVIAQGVSVINKDTVPNNYVFQSSSGALEFKPCSKNILGDFFRHF